MHLSMRVPWMDRPWDGAVCNSPKGNASCVLLKNIGPRRDDAYEQQNAGTPFAQLDQAKLPCLSERATFMSATGYQVVKNHPYAHQKALSILPTPVAVPAYAFEAVPFRWLSRKSLSEEIGHDRVPGFRVEAEDAADHVLGFGPAWVMDGANQQEVISSFFEPVTAMQSLVFMYLKHSPLQEARTDRLLVGAALVTGIQAPPMWGSDGPSAFESSMWETVVTHSLRPDQKAGILLPYQDMVTLQDGGVDVSSALAWAPEGRGAEFSYVTEHLSDDAALQALASLKTAAAGSLALGLSIASAAMEWVDAQIERLWELRGPTPGLAAVLSYLGVESAFTVARAVVESAAEGDTWAMLEAGFANEAPLPSKLASLLPSSVARVWSRRTPAEQAALKMLSGLDVTAEQVALLLDGSSCVPLAAEDLVEDPYSAAICTYTDPAYVPFATVDRACFPDGSVTWTPLVPELCGFTDHHDFRRIRALLTDVLERAADHGDTLLGQAEAIQLGNAYELTRRPVLTKWLLEGHGLDSPSLAVDPDAWPMVGVELARQQPGLKLWRFAFTADVIRTKIAELRGRPRHADLADVRALIDAALPPMPEGDDAEDRARVEKASGLAELFASPLSVLIGPAGTGKTTLIKALVEEVGAERSVLLAPTGKARVQLASKVGSQATVSTLASYLSRTGRFDDAQRYLVLDDTGAREDVELLVIDEASMLTEEMLASVLDAFRSIKRLVLVGDPRQLPPIGAGRPFVDLVTELRPQSFAGPIHVAPSYVELRVPRRQVAALSSKAGETVAGSRADLDLAAWFGDGDLGADADRIWERLADNPDQETVLYVPWSGRPVQEVLFQAIAGELDLAPISDTKGLDADEAAFALTYGATLNDGWVNWEVGSGEASERWQILSPTRSRAAGSIELNRHIKRTYRRSELVQALRNNWNGSNLPGPIGPEQIVRGDKVMATRNNPRAKSWPAGTGLDYVANGEIGVGIGRRQRGNKKGLRLNVEFSSQPGAQYGYWTSGKEDPALELAWAVTVHKSQGSEFGLTFLVLPARANISRELLYTALTRQRNRVVIVHEGTLADLRELSHPWRSETARRLTDLFEAPTLVTIDPGNTGQPQRYDGRILHVTAGGIVVKSKNEVIVSGVLDEVAPERWSYETPITGSDGRTLHQDFTIQRADGSLVLWEHLGLMGDPDYARKWTLKRAWYETNGYLAHPDRGKKGTLMWTDDSGGVDLPSWRALAEEVIGPVVSGPKRRGPGTRKGS